MSDTRLQSDLYCTRLAKLTLIKAVQRGLNTLHVESEAEIKLPNTCCAFGHVSCYAIDGGGRVVLDNYAVFNKARPITLWQHW